MLTSVFQPTHLIIVLIVAVLVLGPKRLPEAGRALGQGLKEFKSSISGTPDDEAQDQIDVNPPFHAPTVTRPGAGELSTAGRSMEIEQDNSREAAAP